MTRKQLNAERLLRLIEQWRTYTAQDNPSLTYKQGIETGLKACADQLRDELKGAPK